MKPKHHLTAAYRSGLEQRFQAATREHGWDLPYEEDKIKYEIPASKHTYTPDFTVSKTAFIETKGLWVATDRKKAILIKEQHPEIKLLHVLLRNQKIAKNSKTTYLEWAEKHGILACTFADKETWLNFIKENIND